MKKDVEERLDEVHRIMREALEEPQKTIGEVLFVIICWTSLVVVPIIALLPYQYGTIILSSVLISLTVMLMYLSREG